MSPEVCPPQPLAVQAQRQRGVCLKAALVKFIKHHCAHTPQLRVLQQPKCRFVLVSTALLYIRQNAAAPTLCSSRSGSNHSAAECLSFRVQQPLCAQQHSGQEFCSPKAVLAQAKIWGRGARGAIKVAGCIRCSQHTETSTTDVLKCACFG